MGLGSLSLNQMAGEPQVQPGDAVVALKDIEIWSISRTNKKTEIRFPNRCGKIPGNIVSAGLQVLVDVKEVPF